MPELWEAGANPALPRNCKRGHSRPFTGNFNFERIPGRTPHRNGLSRVLTRKPGDRREPSPITFSRGKDMVCAYLSLFFLGCCLRWPPPLLISKSKFSILNLPPLQALRFRLRALATPLSQHKTRPPRELPFFTPRLPSHATSRFSRPALRGKRAKSPPILNS